MHADTTQRGGFSGMWQIFLYNWHFYAAALVLDVIAVVFLVRFPPPAGIRIAVMLACAIASFWALSSLLVSHYVYDRSRLYRWNWLAPVVKQNPDNWANIHAGLDQTSEALIRLFPAAQRRILDIYVPSEMSEPSIERARQHSMKVVLTEKADPLALPLQDRECDAVFLIFVAHELRRRETRLRFLREVARSVKPSGCVVLVEHLRDWENFLAYGPGALHFFSRREWLAVARQAGLDVANEFRITPFVACFVLEKSPDVQADPVGSVACG